MRFRYCYDWIWRYPDFHEKGWKKINRLQKKNKNKKKIRRNVLQRTCLDSLKNCKKVCGSCWVYGFELV